MSFGALQVTDFEYAERPDIDLKAYAFVRMRLQADPGDPTLGILSVNVAAPVRLREGETIAQLRARTEAAVRSALVIDNLHALIAAP